MGYMQVGEVRYVSGSRAEQGRYPRTAKIVEEIRLWNFSKLTIQDHRFVLASSIYYMFKQKCQLLLGANSWYITEIS